jgi:hypothetical protein
MGLPNEIITMVTFPTTLDALTNPTGTDKVTSPSHAGQHTDANDAIEALEAKVGIDGSTGTTSHDYKLSGVTGTDKAVSKTGNETLTTKTLTSPKIGTAICDTSGNEIIKTPATTNAVNEITITNATAGSPVLIDATGGDTDISIKIKGKGAGTIKLGADELIIPNADGTPNQVLKTDGSSTLGWVDQAATPSCISLFPKPVALMDNGATDPLIQTAMATNTIMCVGQIVVPVQIIVASIIICAGNETTEGTYKVGIYSESGQTKHIDVTTATIATPNIQYATAVSPAVTLPPGIYYVAIVPVSTSSYEMWTWCTMDPTLAYWFGTATGQATLEGTVTVTAGTLPATFSPTADITALANKTLSIRLES